MQLAVYVRAVIEHPGKHGQAVGERTVTAERLVGHAMQRVARRPRPVRLHEGEDVKRPE
jgi:hypothetical protein